MAAVLATGGILSHHSAAKIWGIRPHDGAIDITVTGPAVRSRPGLRIHRARSLDAAVQDGLPLTTPARTLHDLAGCLGQHERRSTTTLELTRSAAERRLLALIRQARLPRPETNVRVQGYEVDLLWRRQRLIVEVDGFAYHSTRHAFERDRARDATLQAAGYRVVRITWRQIVNDSHALVAQLTRLIHA